MGSLHRLTWSTSALFRAGQRPVSGELYGNRRRLSVLIPVSSFLSASGIGFLDHPVPAGELGLPHGRLTRRYKHLDPNGVSTFRTCEIRLGWAPPRPRGGGVHPAGRVSPAGACRFSATSPAPRWNIPSTGGQPNEASSGVHSRSPVQPSPRPWPPDGTVALRLES